MFGPVTIVLFIILFTIWILRRRKHFNSFVKLGIPGPKPNLLFGNMWELYWKGPLSCLQSWIDQHGKVFIYFFGMRPVLVVMDLDLLKEIQIKDFMDFADRPVRIVSTHVPFVKCSLKSKSDYCYIVFEILYTTFLFQSKPDFVSLNITIT
ncbi:cytochrome P450 3A27-like [Tachypleus tridentatus]|uniref:cytochrome P450 3A27-like n=1 Tax=Tachypleus tridentatus TaxID=6853 RepID=UPI003FD2B832